ncbi:hypothetical protein BGZ63DRAFT_415663 [Mariannaea sp. PMI_226]|nr:hypothetical protein BGZ63DRAFT_415663 [Mariannaea sp. PMI_226]
MRKLSSRGRLTGSQWPPLRSRRGCSHAFYANNARYDAIANSPARIVLKQARSACRPTRSPGASRELLDRLRYYESLLRQNDIDFVALHPDHPSAAPKHASPDEGERSANTSCRDLWQAISRVTLNAEDYEEDGDGDENASANSVNESILLRHGEDATKAEPTQKDRIKGQDQINNFLLFVPLIVDVDLSGSHPDQVQIFRLWQVYLDNVNPLLKVTHTPTLQPRIIDAVANIANTSPTFEALLFSIYCISIVSLDENECINLFGLPKQHLLASYQLNCQHALLKCSLWRFCDVEGLTALYLYLVSISSQTDMRCLSCMLASVIRIAQRLGIHSESSYAECTALEAEMRRRLWWSLVSFDYRLCELSDYKTTMLVPTWDCKTPFNLNDFEIRADAKTAAIADEKPTEAFYAVVRSELADFVRNSSFHLNFVNPSLNALAQPKSIRQDRLTEGDELAALERMAEDKYLALCDTADHLHYMTIWTTRASVARSRLLDHYSRYSKSSVAETDAQRSVAISYALRMLESDTNLRTSPLTQRYSWFINLYLPALAFLYTLNDLRKWPASSHAEQAWAAIGENYDALILHSGKHGRNGAGIYVQKFSQLVLQAWEAREAFLQKQRKPPEQPPRIVWDVKSRHINDSASVPSVNADQGQSCQGPWVVGSSEGSANPPMLANQVGHDGIQEEQESTSQGHVTNYPDEAGEAITDVEMNQFWPEIDWRWMQAPE